MSSFLLVWTTFRNCLPLVATHVVRHGISSREPHGTPLTAVWLHPSMGTFVRRKVTALVEGFPAGIASVCSLARVNPHVLFEITGPAERCRTFSTLMRLLLRVDS